MKNQMNLALTKSLLRTVMGGFFTLITIVIALLTLMGPASAALSPTDATLVSVTLNNVSISTSTFSQPHLINPDPGTETLKITLKSSLQRVGQPGSANAPSGTNGTSDNLVFSSYSQIGSQVTLSVSGLSFGENMISFVEIASNGTTTHAYTYYVFVPYAVSYDMNCPPNANNCNSYSLPTGFYTGASLLTSPMTYNINGYYFINWNTSYDGSGTSYTPNDVIDGLTGDITLYAQWTQDPTPIAQLSVSQSTFDYGDSSVNLTVTEYDPNDGVTLAGDDGTQVDFYYANGTYITSCTLMSSTCTVSQTASGRPIYAGSQNVYAVVQTSSNFYQAVSNSVPVTVQKISPVLTSTLNSGAWSGSAPDYTSVLGDTLQFAAGTSTDYSRGATVQLYDNGVAISGKTCVVDYYHVGCTISYVPTGLGNHSITLGIPEESNYVAEVSTTTNIEVINPVQVSISEVGSNSSSPTYGDSLSYVANVQNITLHNATGPTVGGDTVDLYASNSNTGSGGVLVGTCVLNQVSGTLAQCTVTTSLMPAGADTVWVYFPGDSNWSSASSSTLSKVVNQYNLNSGTLLAPNLTLSTPGGTNGLANTAPQAYTDSFTYGTNYTIPTPSDADIVAWNNGDITYGSPDTFSYSINPTGNSAGCSINSDGSGFTQTGAGTCQVIITSTNTDGNFTSGSETLSLTIGKATPTVTVTDDSNGTTTTGSPVTFTATVTGAGATPTGTVTFYEGGVELGACNVQALGTGSAICWVTFYLVGTKVITASYSGNDGYFAVAEADSVADNFVVTVGPPNAAYSQLFCPDNISSITADQSETCTITLFDAYGNPITTGGNANLVVFSADNGSFGAVTDNGDGTYSATWTPGGAFTGLVTVSGSVDGVSAGIANQSFTVVPGAAVPGNSTFTCTANSNATISCLATLFDAEGNQTLGGDSVVVYANAGMGSFTSVVDNSDGTYTTTFTPGPSFGGFVTLSLWVNTVDTSLTQSFAVLLFDSNNGSGDMAQQISDLAANLNSNTFSFDQHYFVGWSTTTDGPVVYQDGGLFGFINDLTLYAIWHLVSYDVVYDPTNGDSTTTGSEEYSSDPITQAPADPTRLGYTFLGWNTDPSAIAGAMPGDYTVPVDGMTLYAIWTVSSVDVVYHPANGGNTVTVPELVGSDPITQAPTDPTRSGYTFLGWNTDPSAIAGAMPGDYTVPIGGMDLYAIWGSTVSYDANTGDGGSVPTDTSAYFLGDTIYVPVTPVPTLTNFTFDGWCFGYQPTLGSNCDPAYAWDWVQPGSSTTMPDGGSIIAYAVWGSRVSYNANTGDGGSLPSDSTIYFTNDTINVPLTPVPTLTNYTFGGWCFGYQPAVGDSCDAGFNWDWVQPGDWTSAPAGDTNVYAVWGASVQYDSNTGTGTVPIDTGIYYTGDYVNTPATPGVLLSGYTFDGWCAGLAPDLGYPCSSDSPYWAWNSDSFLIPAGGNLKLYAVWGGTIYYNLGYGWGTISGGPTSPQGVYTFGDPVPVDFSNNPSQYWFEFTGWCDSQPDLGASCSTNFYQDPTQFTGGVDQFNMGSGGDVVLYAVWAQQAYYDWAGGSNGPTDNTYYYTGDQVTINFTDIPTNSGYVFGGWTLWNGWDNYPYPVPGAGTITLDGGTYGGNLLFSADWGYGVSYDANGGVGPVPVDNNSYNLGDSVTVLDAPNPTFDGYQFDGWCTYNPNPGDGCSNNDYYQASDGFSMPDYPVTLYAVWGYTLSYNGNGYDGGAIPTDNRIYVSGQSAGILESPTPTLNGYEFNGWCLNHQPDLGAACDNSPVVGFNFPSSGNSTLFAIWGGSVTYNANGGSAGLPSDSGIYNAGDTVQVPSTPKPALDGYTFYGWCVGDNPLPGDPCNGVVEVAAGGSFAMPSGGNVTLYAMWGASVFYDSNGGSSDIPATQSVYLTGETVSIPSLPTPTLDGYVFAGWCTAAAAPGDVCSANSYGAPEDFFMPAGGDITLYALWAGSLTYNPNGGDGGSVPTDTRSYVTGDEITVQYSPLPTLNGYSFYGWCFNYAPAPGEPCNVEVPTTSESMPAGGNAIAYAMWGGMVTYDANGGDGVPTDTTVYLYNDTVTVPSGPAPTRTGYAFDGWCFGYQPAAGTSCDGGSNWYWALNGNSTTMPYGDITAYAVWGGTVTYDANGGDGLAVPTDTNVYVNGDQIVVPSTPVPTRTGYTFDGWCVGGAAPAGTECNLGIAYDWVYPTDYTYMPDAGNITLYANWAGSITYNANTGTSGSVPVDNNVYYQGQTVTVPSSPVPTLNGYTFDGWCFGYQPAVGSSCSGSDYAWVQPGDTVLMPYGDMVAFAVWGATVTYDLNDYGLGTITGGPIDNYGGQTNNGVYFVGDTVTVDFSNNPSQYWFEFMGWCDVQLVDYGQSCTGNLYTDPSTFELGLGGNVTLYATWAQQVYYDANDGSGGPVDTRYYYMGDTATVLFTDLPTRTGYTFGGWNLWDGSDYFTYPNPGTGSITFDGAYYSGNAILYAWWGFGVSYDTNTGSGTPPSDPTAYYPGDTVNVSFASNPSLTNYEFLGWCDQQLNVGDPCSGNFYSATDFTSFIMPSDNVTLYAVWGGTVTYTANGGDQSSVPQDTTVYVNGEAVNIPSGPNPTLDNYVFEGWCVGAQPAAGDPCPNGYYWSGWPDSFTMDGMGNVTLYAVWGGTVTYDANGGDQSSAPQDSYFYVNGEMVNIPSGTNPTLDN